MPGTAQTHGSVATKCAEEGCDDGCEDKGVGSELHCMSEHCQSSPFYSLPLLNHFSPGEVCYGMKESMLQERRWYLSKGCQTLIFTWGEKGNDKVLTPYIETGIVSCLL